MKQLSLSPERSACVEDCWNCHRVCLNMATGHCLEMGGRHVEPEHLRTMLACAEMCRTAAWVMLSGSTLHRQVCAVCADICDACMSSCQALDQMDECLAACKKCKDSCEAMTAA